MKFLAPPPLTSHLLCTLLFTTIFLPFLPSIYYTLRPVSASRTAPVTQFCPSKALLYLFSDFSSTTQLLQQRKNRLPSSTWSRHPPQQATRVLLLLQTSAMVQLPCLLTRRKHSISSSETFDVSQRKSRSWQWCSIACIFNAGIIILVLVEEC